MDNDIVFRSNRFVIPADLRKDVMKKIHEGHIGMEGSLRRAREHVFWPGTTSHVKDYVSKCTTCQSMGQRQPNINADRIRPKAMVHGRGWSVSVWRSSISSSRGLPQQFLRSRKTSRHSVQHSDSVAEKTLWEIWYSAGVKNRQWPAVCSQWISKV